MRAFATVLLAGVTAAALLWGAPAEACGGFFCGGVPIDQSAERIIFSVSGKTVEAHVQISYQGDAKSFSWVVPTQAQPTLSIGSPSFFNAVTAATQPRFQLTWTEDSCFAGGRGGFGFGPPSAAMAKEADAADAGVSVISQEQVGPYDAAVLQATSAASLTAWLNDNGYLLTPEGAEALTPYVGTGYYFVALKLQQDKSVGDLRPIVLTLETGRPCIPIRLTAIAARPNMPIVAYVFAEHRAVPQNFQHVLINESRVDWLRFGSNYNALASDAVDEAGGRAFLTEFAGAVSTVRSQMWQLDQGAAWNTAVLRNQAHPVDFLQALLNQGFPRDGALQNMLRRFVPIPKALVGQVSEAQFYNSIATYRAAIDADPGRAPFDAAGFADELEKTVVAPLRHANEIVTQFPYLTRLYTTMSADEMTVDPEFQFNADVPDVSNVHTAKATGICNLYNPSDQRVRIELDDGRFFFVTPGDGPFPQGPSAQRIEQMPAEGAPIVLRDNAEAIARLIQAAGGGITPPGGGCGCGAGGAEPALLWALLGAVSLARRARRK